MIYVTARFRVNSETFNDSLYAINDHIDYVKTNEPGTLQYVSVNDHDDPFSFLHFMVFQDEAAEEEHRSSPGGQAFAAGISPYLVGDVEFKRWREVGSAENSAGN